MLDGEQAVVEEEEEEEEEEEKKEKEVLCMPTNKLLASNCTQKRFISERVYGD